MTRLIVNADDMGFSLGVNAGVIEAYKRGIVTSCSIMATMPGFEDAIEKLKDNKGLGTGVHLTLSSYEPLLKGHKTIVDKNGKFYKYVTEEIAKNFDEEEILKEFTAQIEKVLSSGIKITHFDSHHHVHQLPQLKGVMQKLVDKYKLPIRGGINYKLENAVVIPVLDSFYKEGVSIDYFKKNIDKFKELGTSDLMTHPAWVDDVLLNSTSYAIDRIKEYEVLTSEKVLKILKENNIELISYGEL
ncbi:carbohydrate deacetylase [Clostridium tarantellae]|uniref:ChbG/HpnK family deacetylase n=1 Tax=Clostridium tarantellae TaxID=39493 RepID=A0A6I1MQ04_9CLOT|nr:carbohydrate deacetylase [Clostridium tarantellae]MPQ44893.1 ChbG/HpnK family deacetylase [Clostridium tarantellae]